MPEISLKVTGMTCNHCKMTVEKHLGQIPGIKSVNADILNGIVSLSGDDINLSIVETTLQDLGYVSHGRLK